MSHILTVFKPSPHPLAWHDHFVVRKGICWLIVLWIALHMGGVVADAEHSWPTFAHDNRRSATTAMPLDLPLVEIWTHQTPAKPQPAWPPPAKNDYWHRKHGLNPRVTFDHAYQVVAANDCVYFGSSATDRIVCLDATTGGMRWSFFTEGPVRLAPTLQDGKLLAGSDDGYLYCLLATSGQLVWKARPGTAATRCIGNGRIISRWPVRSGVLVEDEIAYCAAGIFPASEGVFLAGYRLADGQQVLHRRIDQSVQGYMAGLDDQLYLASGRTSPGIYLREDGERNGTVSSAGGAFAFLADDLVAAGPGDADGELSLTDPHSKERLMTFRGLHLIAHQDRLIVHARDQLAALDRDRFLSLATEKHRLEQTLNELKEKQAGAEEQSTITQQLANVRQSIAECQLWKTTCDCAESLILVGDLLFAGGKGHVSAFALEDGREQWTASVDGRACGLAAAQGRLLVSTDQGSVHCFETANPSSANQAVTDLPITNSHTESLSHRVESALAASLIQLSHADQGFGLLIEPKNIDWAFDLARRTRLRIVILHRDAQRVQAMRQQLFQEGLYGTRIVVHHLATDEPVYPPYFANLVVLNPKYLSADNENRSEDWPRLVRPYGGRLLIGPLNPAEESLRQKEIAKEWLDKHCSDGFDLMRTPVDSHAWCLARRGPLAGAGEWTHGFAEPGHSACSQDQLVQGALRIQWFGRPGPRPMADRHHRAVPPLSKDGRLFVPGENQVIVVDAYNGAQLWRREIPRSLRLGTFLDCSNMVVDDRSFYITAVDHCHQLDVTDGQPQQVFQVPQLDSEQTRHWGYLARADQWLVGSARKPDASYYRQSYEADLALWYDRMAMVTSDYLFAVNPATAETAWTYRSGLIVNTTITIGGGRVYFLESQSPEALAESRGRMPMMSFLKGPNSLVALDLATGEPVWRVPLDLEDAKHIAYLNYASEKLVFSGNRYVDSRLWYFFTAFDATSGQQLWQAAHNSGYAPQGDHGEQNRHPTIVGDTVFTYPLAYNLHTGEQLTDWTFDRMGHGCGNISASANSIYWRGGNPWRCDVGARWEPQPVNGVTRPGCFINMIPAGGLLLIPEASSGCTCGFPLQTSLAYVPASLVE